MDGASNPLNVPPFAIAAGEIASAQCSYVHKWCAPTRSSLMVCSNEIKLQCFEQLTHLRVTLQTGRNPMHTGLDPLNWTGISIYTSIPLIYCHIYLDMLNWTATILRGEGCEPPESLAGCDSSPNADYVFLPRLLATAGYESHMLGKVRRQLQSSA